MDQIAVQEFERQHLIYLLKRQKEVLLQFLQSVEPKQYVYYSLNMHEYLDEWPQLCIFFREKQLTLFKQIIVEQIIEAQSQLLRQKKGSDCFVKDRVYVFLDNLPAISNFKTQTISILHEKEVNKIILFEGIVVQTGEIKALVLEQQVQCSLCNKISTIVNEASDCHRLQSPSECGNMVERTKKSNKFFEMLINKYKKKQDKKEKNPIKTSNNVKCGGKKFELIPGTEHLIDYQEIKVQDGFSKNLNGNIQRSVRVLLYGSLINSCKAGDTVNIGGIIVQRWLKESKNQRPTINQIVDCQQINLQNISKKVNSIPNHRLNSFSQSENEQIEQDVVFRQKLIKSTCPHICEREDLKLAILLCLVGGVTTTIDQTQIRGNSHILLVGEPGTGKSSILQYISKMAPKAIYTNGIGSTSAGLTLSYVREESGWVIQAGAMVLADQGVCCIDEFNLIQKPQLESILEALEQQTVSSQKAGLSAKLNARTTLIAACNPTGPGQKYRQNIDVSENTGLSSPLISRFDLIFVLVDEICEDRDRISSQFILQKYMGQDQVQDKTQIFGVSELQEYITFVKKTFSPTVSYEAQQILQNYYVKIRQKHHNITVRLLESLIRLTQAHSKLMKRQIATSFDALSILILIENTGSQSLGLAKNTDQSDSVLDILELHCRVKEQLNQNI